MRHRIVLVFILILITGCHSKDGDFNVFSVADDIQMGEEFKNLVAAESQNYPVLPADDYPEAYGYINSITGSILQSPAVLHREEFPWQVHIIHNDSVLNAFCTPGGYIYVYTGLIHFLDSEDELAGVLGHEIAHADLRHSTEQLTRNYGLQLLIRVIAGDASLLGNAAGSLLSLSFSRGDESEADIRSVDYLTGTVYDPRGVARFFEKMEKNGDSMGPLVFLSTHPNPENRVDKIYTHWTKLGQPDGEIFKERYQKLKASLPPKVR